MVDVADNIYTQNAMDAAVEEELTQERQRIERELRGKVLLIESGEHAGRTAMLVADVVAALRLEEQP